MQRTFVLTLTTALMIAAGASAAKSAGAVWPQQQCD